MNALLYIAIGALLCGAVRLMGRRFGFTGIAALCALLMCLVSGLSEIPISIGGWTTNFSNALYAPVIFGSVLACLKFGRASAFRQVRIVFAVAVTRLAVVWLAAFETGPIADVLRHSQAFDFRVVFASFFAFAVANVVAVELADARRPVVGLMAAQAVDSLVFFPMAFGGTAGAGLVLQSVVAGFALKAVVSLCAAPLLLKIKPEKIP